MDKQVIKKQVQDHYAAVAQRSDCGCSSECCGSESAGITPLVAYGDLADEVLEGADLGLGCGLPTRDAGIRPGDTVLDLGSGAGVDVFLAAKAVGPQGKVIGVDMTPAMIARAWEIAVRGGYTNVDFRLGEIQDLPVAEGTVDVAISNCVINLVPDKGRVFSEIYRVLRIGGRFSISDMVTSGNVPEDIRSDMALWAGCVAGAMDREAYLEVIRAAGFTDINVKDFVEYDYLRGSDYGIASITVEARKG